MDEGNSKSNGYTDSGVRRSGINQGDGTEKRK